MTNNTQALPEVVSQGKWRIELDRLLIKEKELTRERDALNAERRKLPMVRVDKRYTFQGEKAKSSLLYLFEGRRQLMVYHFILPLSGALGVMAAYGLSML